MGEAFFNDGLTDRAVQGESAIDSYMKDFATLCAQRRPDESFYISTPIVEDAVNNSNSYYETYADMAELGIQNFPLEKFTLNVPAFTEDKNQFPPGSRYLYHVYPDGCWLEFDYFGERRELAFTAYRIGVAKFLCAALVVLLATPNVTKSRKDMAYRLNLGAGGGDRGRTTSRYVTRLEIGKVEYEDDGLSVISPDRKDIRPHLRRGHIRLQPYGEGHALRKKIFVPPCFVNGDPAFYPKRDHYEVRMAQHESC